MNQYFEFRKFLPTEMKYIFNMSLGNKEFQRLALCKSSFPTSTCDLQAKNMFLANKTCTKTPANKYQGLFSRTFAKKKPYLNDGFDTTLGLRQLPSKVTQVESS